MKRHSPAIRAHITLRALVRFAKARDYWPSAPELTVFVRPVNLVGSREAMLRLLASLRRAGLVELDRRSSESAWRPTLTGFERVGKRPFCPISESSRKARHLGLNRMKGRRRNALVRRAAFVLLERGSLQSEEAVPPWVIPSPPKWTGLDIVN